MRQHKNSNNSNMSRGIIFIGFFIYMMAASCCCHPVMSSEIENIARPTRPKTFGSPNELRSYLDQLGQYLAVVSRPRFGKRKSELPVLAALPKPKFIDQQRVYNNMFNREDDDAYKLQYRPAIRNSKDLYDMLFSTRRENGNNRNRNQYSMQPDSVVDIGFDSN